jgi:copper chaperone
MEYTFKTNINCGGCVAKVQPVLDAATGIEAWSVNTQTHDKVLTVKTEALTPAEIVSLVQTVGFSAEQMKKGWFR